MTNNRQPPINRRLIGAIELHHSVTVSEAFQLTNLSNHLKQLANKRHLIALIHDHNGLNESDCQIEEWYQLEERFWWKVRIIMVNLVQIRFQVFSVFRTETERKP